MSFDKINPDDLKEFGLGVGNTAHKDSRVYPKQEEASSVSPSFEVPCNRTDDKTSKETTSCDTNSQPVYPGDINRGDDPEDYRPDDELQTIDFPNPAILLNTIDSNFREGYVSLHPWQIEIHEQLCKSYTSFNPFKFCLCAANGSGKDAFVIAPFCIWFALTKKRSLTIITSSSGTQLTAQTETYIKSMAELCNKVFGAPIFKVRQRYIKCLISGSEIRMFATDEAGKAEGYHPLAPNAEMAIIVNEGKSVSEEIHGALKRCTGFNYWLEVSTPGEPFGFFYRAFTVDKMNFHIKRVTAYDCPHIPKTEIEADLAELGEHSALFRSMRLALFTSLGGNVIIPADLIERFMIHPVTKVIGQNWKVKVGIDIAAGGDENSIHARRGNQIVFKKHWRESDTTVTADEIHNILRLELNLSQDYDEIYIDDGHVGHSITDMLVRRGWKNINRVLNQSVAAQRKRYGNLGAEMWDIVKRIIEEGYFDVRQLDDKTRTQLSNRYYKQQQTQGRITLQSKKEAKAEGRPSPDRADSFILTFRGHTLDDFIEADKGSEKKTTAEIQLKTPQEVYDYFQEHQFDEFQQRPSNSRVNGSLSVAMKQAKKPQDLLKYGLN